jgi:hypothetical protein
VFVFRVTDIPVRVERTQILATHRFHVQRGFYLCGDVLCVHVVDDVAERHDIHLCVIYGVHSVIDCNVPYIMVWEKYLDISTRFKIIPSQS